jgi:beta-N-acetylhexosaminidase
MKSVAAGHAPLIIDIAGLSLSPVDIERLRHPMTGGLILFSRNWQSRAQLSDLCAHIKSVRPDALIAVDHEGGRVQRFRTDGFTHLPPLRRLGEWWMKAQDQPAHSALQACAMARDLGWVLASELRACGVDFSFTPVLDLDHGPSAVIGDRSFSRDPRVVAVLAQSLMLGLAQAGMSNCGKHFPGHGFVAADSHVDVPVDPRSLADILADCALPYHWLASALSSIMPAHVIYPQVDELPAGFSSRWLKDILRRQLGFEGAIFSDDLSMEGARHLRGQTLSYTQAAELALQAGCDLVLLCNQSVPDAPGQGRALDELLDGLATGLAKGRWQASERSEQRRLALLPTARAMDWAHLIAHPAHAAALERLRSISPSP